MSKPLDPERPGKFSSSLVAGLSIFLDSMALRSAAREPPRGLRAQTGPYREPGGAFGH
jgi:hypothetical protein